jgi:PAS domain S-box-containing protein
MRLKNKFAMIMILIGFIIIISISLFYNYYFQQIAIKKDMKRIKNISKSFSIDINNDFKKIVANIITISSAPVLKDYLLKSNSYYSQLPDSKRKEKINLLNNKWMRIKSPENSFIKGYMENPAADYLNLQKNINPDFYGEIFLTNNYGVMAATTNKLTTLAHSHKYWWEACYDNGKGKIFIDDRGFDTSVNGYVLGIVVPVKHNNNLIGILKCNINIKNLLSRYLEKYKNLYSFGEMKIVRSGGKVIFGSNVIPLTTKVSKSTINSFQQKTNVTKIADKNSKEKIIGSSPISITMGTDNINFGGSYESIDHIKGNKGENWQVLLLVNEEEVLKDFNQVNIMFIYTGLIFTIITALIAFVIGDKLARPLRYIASIAKSIGEGNFKKRVNLKRNDEISYLGKSLNQMANKLQKTMISKTRLETILETIQDGYWVVNLKGEIIEVNRAYLDISGYSEKELIGMKVAEIDAKKNEEEFNNHLEKVKKSGHHFFETKHETKEGKIINVEVSVSFLNTIFAPDSTAASS